MTAENEFEIPTEFDGLYKLVFYRTGGLRTIEFNYAGIADKIKAKLGVISFKGQIFVYKNGIYREGEALVKKEIARIIKGIKTAKMSGDSINKADSEILYYIKFNDPCLDWPFNKHPNMIPVNNGIVKIDFENGFINLIPFSQDYIFNYKIPVDYNPYADSKLIDSILHQYVENKDVLYQIPAQALLQVLGYASYKKCYLLHGRNDAGKSTYLQLLYETFGYDNKSDISLHDLNPEKSRFKLAGLMGKLFNIHDDLSNIPLKDAGVLKKITGDYSHDVEIKGVQPFRAHLTAVHVFACNQPPTFDCNIDGSFWSRWEYVYFPNSFKRDSKFHSQVFTPENLSGYFNGVLETVIKIERQNELICNMSESEVRDAWTLSAEPVYLFIKENMVKGDNAIYLKKEEFLQVVQNWGESNGFKDIPQNVTELSKKLNMCGIVTDAKGPADENGYRAPAYKFLYDWREHTRWWIQPIKWTNIHF